MSLVVYLYHKCSTCQKALKYLEKTGLDYEVREITQNPPSRKELELMLQLQSGELKKLFNTSGILYRELKLSLKLAQMDINQGLDLLSSNGMLVKRPFLIGQGIGLLGFYEDKWTEALSKIQPIPASL